MANAAKKFGISKETTGSSSIKFKLNPEINGGLSIGTLKEVTIGEASYKESQKGNFAEFAGKTLPTINFVFAGMSETKGKEPVYIHSFKPMPIIPNDSKFDWFYDSMFQTIKHFIDVLTDDNFVAEYEPLLELDLDFEKGMSFEDLKAAYTKFFGGIVEVFNGNKDLPCIYKDTEGKATPLWMKLLLYFNNNEVNNGNPGFSGYPGEGLIEKYVPDHKPSMRIAIEKGESIIPRAKAKPNAAPAASSSGAPTAGSAPVGGGDSVPGFMQG